MKEFTWALGAEYVYDDSFALRAGYFNESEDNFRVITGNMGGSFGMKQLYSETILTVWASKKLKRPVKWENERQESILSDYHGRDKVSDIELALDESGNFLAIRATTYANLGTYLSPLAFMHTLLSNGGLVGVYKTPAIHLTVKGVLTNTGSTNPYRAVSYTHLTLPTKA